MFLKVNKRITDAMQFQVSIFRMKGTKFSRTAAKFTALFQCTAAHLH